MKMRLRTRMGWSFGQVGKINNLRTLNHLGIAVVTDKVTLRTLQKRGSTMQKTGWTIHSSFLVLYGLEKGFTLDVTTRGSQQPFSCVLGHLRYGDNKQTNNQVILVQACS